MVKLFGGVALVRPEESSDVEETVQRIRKSHPNVKAILRYWGIEGEFRRPRIEVLWGSIPDSIVYREYGVEFELDPASLMFCLGNKFERLRTAAMIRSWEVIVDMFAGVGQFSIPIAYHAKPKRIHAIEINPDAYGFLVKNIERNRVSEIVEPHLGDCREVAGQIGRVADRVIMGYLHDTISFLPYALGMLSTAGGIIHLHSLALRGREDELAANALSTAERLGYRASLLGQRFIKSYSPSKLHIAVELFAIKQ
ncbi:MAG: hypothetical protein QXM16_01130 [Nitrososphaerota archaeon]